MNEKNKKNEKVEEICNLSLFEHVPAEILAPLATYFIPKRYERGDHLWREGTPAKTFFFICQGQVKVIKFRNDGGEVILGVFGADQAVGHLATYKEIPFPASAVALEDTHTLEIHRSHFFGTIQKHPALLEALLHSMMHHNQELVRRLHELSVGNAEQRLAMLFLKFAESCGRRLPQNSGSPHIHVPMPLSRADISNLINVRVETAIRIMSRWNKQGPVRTDDKGFTITNLPHLEELATQFA